MSKTAWQKKGWVVKARKRKTSRMTIPPSLRPELKFTDKELVNSAFSGTWTVMDPATVNTLSGVTQGDTSTDRDGRVYYIHSIHYKMFIITAAVESQISPFDDIHVRVCLVQDTQTNKAQLSAADVMISDQTSDILSYRNLDNTQRFRILFDKQITIHRPQQTNEGEPNKFACPLVLSPVWKFNRTFKTPIKVECIEGTTANVTLITSNSFHIIGVTNDTDALLNYQVRVRFTG